MDEHRAVGQPERRQLRVTGLLPQVVTRTLPQEGHRVPLGGDHLLIGDAGGTEGFLHPPARMDPRAAIVTVADEERGSFWSCWIFNHVVEIRRHRPYRQPHG